MGTIITYGRPPQDTEKSEPLVHVIYFLSTLHVVLHVLLCSTGPEMNKA